MYLFKLDEIGVIFSNLKIIRSFCNIFLYVYIHDSLTDVLLMGLKKKGNYTLLRKKIQKKIFQDFKIFKLDKKKLFKKKYLIYLLQYFFIVYFSSKIQNSY